jgi:predicted nuclease of predicted toxin-antitoxin system
MIKFFVDTHISNEAMGQVRNRGIEVVRCEAVGMADAEDSDLLAYAAENGYVMVSCDVDFEGLHYGYIDKGEHHCGILLLNQYQQCQNIGTIVRAMIEVYELAEIADDLVDVLWRYEP